ncbi:MAG: GNAT family N-acetyltransferase [bacterium]|nr:GNAT family N-acetyltransferase [bacterium]
MKTKVRRMRESEKMTFYRYERAEMYPSLTAADIGRWYDGIGKFAYRYYVLMDDRGEMLGGAILELYDFLKDGRAILDFVAMWIRQEYQRQGLGTFLFKEALRRAMKEIPTGALHIETNTAQGFYRKVLPAGFKEMSIEASDETITFFACPL